MLLKKTILFVAAFFCLCAATLVSASQFLTVTDIHFDPFAACKDAPTCSFINTLRLAPVEQWKALFEKFDTSEQQFRQDVNYAFLKTATKELKAISESHHPQFVIIIGDLLAHKFRKKYEKYSSDKSAESYQDFVKKTFEFLNKEFASALQNSSVYSVVGNNDSYEDDYAVNPRGAFFKDNAILWGSLIKDGANRKEMQNEFKEAGYYSVPLSNNLQLIVINSVLFSERALGKDLDAAALKQLNWLHQALQNAVDHHRLVILTLHLPIGVDVFKSMKTTPLSIVEFWKETYLKRFQQELQQFDSNIALILPGHLHMDWLQLLPTHDARFVPVSGTPSISPVFGNNPGFKIYHYSADTAQIENYDTYFYSLNKENTWQKEYDFNQVYQPHCQRCLLREGMKFLQPVGELADIYRKYYAVGEDAQPISAYWIPYWCSVKNITAVEYQHCILNP